MFLLFVVCSVVITQVRCVVRCTVASCVSITQVGSTYVRINFFVDHCEDACLQRNDNDSLARRANEGYRTEDTRRRRSITGAGCLAAPREQAQSQRLIDVRTGTVPYCLSDSIV